LERKPKGKRLLEGPRRRWENNVAMCPKEIRWDNVDFIHMAQDRDKWLDLVDTLINF
jgi:hypothetical protein